MTTDDKIKDGKLKFDIKREAAKISGLSSGKIDKYKYLTGQEVLPSDQSRIIEQAKFTYSLLGKAFEKKHNWRTKRIKALEGHGKQLVKYNNEKESSNHSKQK